MINKNCRFFHDSEGKFQSVQMFRQYRIDDQVAVRKADPQAVGDRFIKIPGPLEQMRQPLSREPFRCPVPQISFPLRNGWKIPVRTAEACVALPDGGVGHGFPDADRVNNEQGFPQLFAPSQLGQGFDGTDAGMDILQADLPAEVGRLFRPLKIGADSALYISRAGSSAGRRRGRKDVRGSPFRGLPPLPW